MHSQRPCIIPEAQYARQLTLVVGTFLFLIVPVLIPSIELRKTKSNLLTGPYVFILQSPRGPLLVYHSILYILMWQSAKKL